MTQTRIERRFTDGLSFASAVVLHGALLLLVRALIEREPAPAASSNREVELEIELDLANPLGRELAVQPTESANRGDASPPAIVGAVQLTEKTDALVGLPSEAEPAGSEATLEPASPAVAESSAEPRPIDLGLGPDGWQRWVTPAGDGVTRGEAAEAPKSGRYNVFHAPPVSTTGGLQEGVEARTRAVGLGPSGRLISAFHRAANGNDAPQLGKASFYVTVAQSGVVEIALGSSTEPVAGWQAVAAKAAAELRRSPPRIPRGRAGVRLVVDLVAEETMPGGLKLSQVHGPRLEATPPRFRSSTEQKAELDLRNPTAGTDSVPLSETKANVELPGVYVAQQGKVCGYRLGVTPLGPLLQGGCDLSNIGAKPMRIVRATTRGEAFF